jgi:hypothetical protein
LYQPSYLSAGYPPPVFPALTKLLISGHIVKDPAYLTAALSAHNLPRLESLIIRAGIRDHSENTRAFSAEAFRRVRPLRTFAWRTFNADRKPLPVLPPHREFTSAHFAALSDCHRHALREAVA